MDSIYIIGAGVTRLGKHLDKSVKQLSSMAISAALADAGCARDDIQAAWFSNTRQGAMEGQHGIRGQCALRAFGFEEIPIINCDNACASSTTGMNQAYANIRAGLYEVALVVGADKMIYPEKREAMFEAFLGGWDRELADEHMRNLLALGDGLLLPAEAQEARWTSSNQHSVFMDVYAAGARAHMKRYGSTQRQFAAVAAKNHFHSSFNPNAQYQNSMSIEEVLADKPITWPLTRSMCAPISDGAGALVLCAESALKRFDRSRAVRIRATTLASGTNRQAGDDDRSICRIAARKAYAMAEAGPGDLDVVEVHDATAFAEVAHIENMGLCEPGEGGLLAERGDTRLGGRIPVNTSGGLLSKGHPIGATGVIQLHEIVTQLRGEAGGRQVAGARLGAAENGGGFYGLEEAVTAVTILERA